MNVETAKGTELVAERARLTVLKSKHGLTQAESNLLDAIKMEMAKRKGRR